MAGSQSLACIAMKVLMKQDKILPLWILGEALVGTMAGASAVGVGKEKGNQPTFDFLRHFQEVQYT